MAIRCVGLFALFLAVGAANVDNAGSTAPSSSVANKVAIESMENIQIHDGFLAEEKKDIAKEKQVKANKDLSALLQKKTAPDVAEKVAQEAKENIQIHDGFLAEEKKDIAKEKQVKANKDWECIEVGTSKTVRGVSREPSGVARDPPVAPLGRSM